jgi:anti-anti-sigma regulatory factor
MIFARAGGPFKVSPELGEQLLYVDTADLDPDAVTLDMLARFALQARRCGYRVVLRGVSPELAGLIELSGLCAALPIDSLRPGSTQPRC